MHPRATDLQVETNDTRRITFIATTQTKKREGERGKRMNLLR